jgi:hypothetical protein
MNKYLILFLLLVSFFLLSCSKDRSVIIICDNNFSIEGKLIEESNFSFVVSINDRAKFYFPKSKCIMVEELKND